MAESATLLVDEVFPEQPLRQWGEVRASVQWSNAARRTAAQGVRTGTRRQGRLLPSADECASRFASRSGPMGQVLGIVYRCIATHLIKKAGFSRKPAQTGAVTQISRSPSSCKRWFAILGLVWQRFKRRYHTHRRLSLRVWASARQPIAQPPLPSASKHTCPKAAEARRALLELLDDRHPRKSTLVTSQLPVEHWHDYLGNPTPADAILDHLVHSSYRLNLRGESMRKR